METNLVYGEQQWNSEFKSYYVVWKLQNPIAMGLIAGGLNRTM